MAILSMTPAAEIEPQKVKRVWEGRLYPGKISLIAGEPGVGTTNLAVFVASIVSAGSEWPNSDSSARKGDVVYISTKDSAAETLRPRLEANGADLDRVHVIQELNDEQGSRAFSLVVDLRRLEKQLRELDQPRLVIIDRIDECLTGTGYAPFNRYNFSHVRTLLRQLEMLAAKYDLAVVGVTRFVKATAGHLLSRVAGSSALVDTAQSVMMVARQMDNPHQRVLTLVKNNLSRDVDPISFRIKQRVITDDIRAPYITFVIGNETSNGE
jgi:putative DNA primase/helicase